VFGFKCTFHVFIFIIGSYHEFIKLAVMGIEVRTELRCVTFCSKMTFIPIPPEILVDWIHLFLHASGMKK